MKLTAETVIRAPLAELMRRTQTPAEHVRWDLRFTGIEYLPRPSPEAPQRFCYTTRLGGGIEISGWGETVESKAGTGSRLRFGSADPKSLIRAGAGCWVYRREGDFIRFRTVYDYTPRWGWAGRLMDRLVFRPLMLWGTRWSFDRLRLWLEREIPPAVALRLWLVKLGARVALAWVWILEGLVPKVLFVRPEEVELVRCSDWYWPTPEATLAVLGGLEVMAGLILFFGLAERLGAWMSIVAIAALSGLALQFEPMALADPFGGLVKNAGLWLCAVVVLALEPITPKARRARGRPRRGAGSLTPFAHALGAAAGELNETVRSHFLAPVGTHAYRGVMRRVWRRGGWVGWLVRPFLRVGSWMETLFAETGEGVPFELENLLRQEPDGTISMTWDRTFHFSKEPRRFRAVMRFDAERGVLLDRLGAWRHLEAELHARVEDGALVLTSGRQWLRLGPLRLRIPHRLAGRARVREWATPAGSLAIEVTVDNPMLGKFFGYEGEFEPVNPRAEQPLRCAA